MLILTIPTPPEDDVLIDVFVERRFRRLTLVPLKISTLFELDSKLNVKFSLLVFPIPAMVRTPNAADN